MNAGSSQSLMKRSTHGFASMWCVIGGLILAVLVLGVIQYRESCLRTDYPISFTAERFKHVTVGMPVEGVFDQLGYPFLFRVPSLGSRGYFTNLVDVRPILSSETNEVVLEYSRARKGDTFRARQIIVSSNRVIKVDAYEYWRD